MVQYPITGFASSKTRVLLLSSPHVLRPSFIPAVSPLSSPTLLRPAPPDSKPRVLFHSYLLRSSLPRLRLKQTPGSAPAPPDFESRVGLIPSLSPPVIAFSAPAVNKYLVCGSNRPTWVGSF